MNSKPITEAEAQKIEAIAMSLLRSSESACLLAGLTAAEVATTLAAAAGFANGLLCADGREAISAGRLHDVLLAYTDRAKLILAMDASESAVKQ